MWPANCTRQAIPICALYILIAGEVSSLFNLSLDDMNAIVWLSFAGALGQMCIFYTIANFGALT
jgi:hypothetical protein